MRTGNKTAEKKKKDPVIMAMDIVILILLFVMIYAGVRAAFYKSRANEMGSFTQDVGLMSFELQQGDYAGLIWGKYSNEASGKTEASGYHALADYVEAEFFYHVYDAKGYTERASRQRAIMDESRGKLGELSVFADKADKMFLMSE